MSAPDITESRCTTCGYRRHRLHDNQHVIGWACPNCREITPNQGNA